MHPEAHAHATDRQPRLQLGSAAVVAAENADLHRICQAGVGPKWLVR